MLPVSLGDILARFDLSVLASQCTLQPMLCFKLFLILSDLYLGSEGRENAANSSQIILDCNSFSNIWAHNAVTFPKRIY